MAPPLDIHNLNKPKILLPKRVIKQYGLGGGEIVLFNTHLREVHVSIIVDKKGDGDDYRCGESEAH